MIPLANTRSPFIVDGLPAPKGPYVHGVIAGDMLYLGGQIGWDAKTESMPDAIGEQVTNALTNLDTASREAGGSLRNATRLTLYLADMDDLPEVNDAYAAFFGDNLPTRTAVEVSKLVGGGRICIDALVALN